VTRPAVAAGVTDGELERAIEGRIGPVVSLGRRPWEYSTSAPLELITVRLHEGPVREFVLKHLSPRTMPEHARVVKPAFVVRPGREIAVYRHLLAPAGIGPALIASVSSDADATYWLLTERVEGIELYQVGDLAIWCSCAAWLAGMHERFATVNLDEARRESALVSYDREWYAAWMTRALTFFAETDPAGSRRTRAALQWLAQRYSKVIDAMAAWPSTIIHGEFYASNVLCGDAIGNRRVCPVDWEMTAIGPGIVDLAALTLGRWRETDRDAVIAAYAEVSKTLPPAEATEAVMLAQIHLSVQWLGWFGPYQPPPEHRLDWLNDAIERAEALRL
jgi:aminoglycoside phosphotransferase (APT) family kinase protein